MLYCNVLSCVVLYCTVQWCVGFQVKTIWSILLRDFDIELISPFPQPDWDSLVVGPKGKMMCRYRRRKLASA